MCLLRAPGGRGAAPCARGVLRTSAVWGGNAAIWGFFQISGGEEAVSARTAGSETRTWKREHLARGITRTQPERGIFKASSQGAGPGTRRVPPSPCRGSEGTPQMGEEGTGGGSGTSQPPGCSPRAEQLGGEAAVSSMSPTRLSPASHYGQRRRRGERVTDTVHAWQRPWRPTALCFCSSVFSPHGYQDLKHHRAARGWRRHVEPPPPP